MPITTLSLCLVIGFIGGLLGGLLGVGGGVVILPFLLFVLDFPVDVAIGVNITAVVFTALSGSIAHFRMGNIRIPLALQVIPAGITGSIAGSLLFNIVGREYKSVLYVLLSIAFIYVTAKIIREVVHYKSERKHTYTLSRKAGIITILYGFITGLVAGLLGIGGGFILVPVFMYVLGLSIREAVGTALASWLSIAATSSLFKISTGIVNIPAAILTGTGAIIGAQVGARILPKIPQRTVKTLLAVLFLYFAIRLMLEGIS